MDINGQVIPTEVSSNLFLLAGKPVIQGLVRDITERKRAENEIRVLAYYDSLTGLPNRTFYKELLNNALLYAERYGKSGKELVLVGVVFDMAERAIAGWQVAD